MGKRYLVIGAGGREHAIAWKLAHGEDIESVWVAPGNAGIALDPDVTGCVDLETTDFEALAEFAESNDVTLTVIGPEAPLCAGIVDFFQARGLPVFGPSQAAARLEESKAFSKEIMRAAGVQTADFHVFHDLDAALNHVQTASHPLVIKADGLAGGKGVVISADVATSETTLNEFMRDARFGASSASVVIEEFLEGPEMSFIVIASGSEVVPLATSRDHKRVGEGDTGPNTGGMGAVTPSPDDTPELRKSIIEHVIDPVLKEMDSRGAPFTGFLYAGVMLTARGPYVLEFNVRLGDPETQPLMLAMNADLAPLLEAAAAGTLTSHELPESSAACAVVLASEGYPGTPRKGLAIAGLERDLGPSTKVFHAGTAQDESGVVLTAGGRVLAITAQGVDAKQARERAYVGVGAISWDGMHFRRDIGL